MQMPKAADKQHGHRPGCRQEVGDRGDFCVQSFDLPRTSSNHTDFIAGGLLFGDIIDPITTS